MVFAVILLIVVMVLMHGNRPRDAEHLIACTHDLLDQIDARLSARQQLLDRARAEGCYPETVISAMKSLASAQLAEVGAARDRLVIHERAAAELARGTPREISKFYEIVQVELDHAKKLSKIVD